MCFKQCPEDRGTKAKKQYAPIDDQLFVRKPITIVRRMFGYCFHTSKVTILS